MRFDKLISFYNDNSRYTFGEESATEPQLVCERMGNVTDMGIDRSNEVLGSINQAAKIVRLTEPVDETWSYLTIDNAPEKYRLTTDRKPLKNSTLIVGEDVG